MKTLHMLLRAVDGLLTSVALKGEDVGTYYSWRMGRGIQAAATVSHEIIRRLGRGLGLTNTDPAFLEAVRLVNEKCEARYPSLGPSDHCVSDQIKDLMNGVCTFENGKQLALENVSWLQDPYGGVVCGARFSFYSLGWVRDLVEGYHKSGESRYLEPARKLTSRWISECLDTERMVRIWDDHVTALRAITLCKLWHACKENQHSDSDFLSQLLSAIVRHAEKLAHPRFYRARHNHGVTQAYALLAIGLFFPVHSQAFKWVELAWSRLEAQMLDNVSDEGMHREHSPYYHFYVFNQFLYSYQLGQAYGVHFSQAFTERLKKMLTCGAYLLKPDGTLPALGDTCKSSPVVVDAENVTCAFDNSAQLYLYSQSKGASGTLPEENSVYWPNAGLALFRSGWGAERAFEEECFLALRTRTFDTAHIHRDQLSFELYAHGGDLIVDCGGPYAYGEPLREFFLSTAAHNTIVVDGQEQAIGKATVLNWRVSSVFDLLVAEQRSYPGVVHRRVVVFVRPDYFVIWDRLESNARHDYVQFFHLSPSLYARRENLAVVTTSPSGGPTVQIIPLLETGLTLDLQMGSEGAGQGWVCVGERQKVTNTVVIYERSGRREDFAVLLLPQARGVSVPVRAWMEVMPSSAESRIVAIIEGCRDEISISEAGTLTVRRNVC